MNELLLDTGALIWVLGGDRMAPAALQAIGDRPLGVSAVSALELGILMRKGRFRTETDPARWFRNSLGALSATLHALTPDILFASQALPGTFHSDRAESCSLPARNTRIYPQ